LRKFTKLIECWNPKFVAITPYIQNFSKSQYGDVQESGNLILVFLFTSFASDNIWLFFNWSKNNFCIKTMFGSSLPPVVCRCAHVLFTLCLFAHRGVQHILCCVFCLVSQKNKNKWATRTHQNKTGGELRCLWMSSSCFL
jgi:hypothetical protein